MLDDVVASYIRFPRMTPGRRSVAIERARASLEQMSELSHLMPALDEAEAAQRRAIAAHGTWARGKDSRNFHSRTAVELDRDLDRALSALHGSLQGAARAFPVGRDEGRWSRALLDAVFPDGVRAISALPFVDQAAAVDALLERVRASERAEAVGGLGISFLVDRIAEINTAYTQGLSEVRVTYAEVRTIDDEAYLAMLRVLARFVAVAASGDPEDVARAQRLLRPFEDQRAEQARLRSRRAARGDSAASVDPEA